MSDAEGLIARAKADLHRAESATERAREALRKAEAEVADLEAFLRMMDRYASSEISRLGIAASVSSSKSPPPSGSRAKELVDAAIEAIRTAGQPLPIGDLLDAVIAQGFKFGGQDHKSNLAGYLSRDPRVVSRGRGVGWDIADEERHGLIEGEERLESRDETGPPSVSSDDDFDRLLG